MNMQTPSFVAAGKANSALAKMGAMTPASGSTNRILVKTLKELFPVKTWAFLIDLLGISERGAKHRTEGTREFNIDEVATLLRTEEGFDFLTAIMANSQPKWWSLVSAYMEVREGQKLQDAARQRLRRAVRSALHADADITAAIARAELLAIHDPEFHGPTIDALGTVARVGHRALAPTSKRR